MPATDQRGRFRASRAFAVLAAGFALVFAGALLLLARDQQLVLQAVDRLQRQTVPETIRHQRLGRNLDQLRNEGERIFSASTTEARQQSLFVVTLIASHPSVIEHPHSAALAREVERTLGDAVRQAQREPALLKTRYAEWTLLAQRLSLQVDDILIEGANLANGDLTGVATTMEMARLKLIGTLILVGASLLSMLILLRRHLIRPLEKIDRTLMTLSVEAPPPVFPETALVEIHAVEDAIGHLHASLLNNEEARRELETLANRDGLTGLANRRHFMAQAEAELLRAHRYGRQVTVGMADLDSFKQLNDTYGHAAGDAVLKSFSRLLQETIRQSDLACRFGGEEFAFVFPETGIEEAWQLAERFRQRFAEYDQQLPGGGTIRVTFSVGLADASRRPIETALRHADDALYAAKRAGRNRIAIDTETPPPP